RVEGLWVCRRWGGGLGLAGGGPPGRCGGPAREDALVDAPGRPLSPRRVSDRPALRLRNVGRHKEVRHGARTQAEGQEGVRRCCFCCCPSSPSPLRLTLGRSAPCGWRT